MSLPPDGAALAEALDARLEGDVRPLTRLVPPLRPAPGGVAVAGGAAELAAIRRDPAFARLGALVVPEGLAVEPPRPPLLRHAAPRAALARLTRLADDEPRPAPGVADGAWVDAQAEVADGASVAAGAWIGPGAVLAEGAVVDPGAIVGAGCRLGPDARVFPRAVLYPRVRLGARTRVHAGAVLGADGFGYAPGPAGAEKIHHLGGVRLGDDVEIGANTCVDRGTLEDSVVGDGTKIDDLCLVAHNVRIGRHCLIAGQVAIGGSTVIEDLVMIGGAASLADHVTVHAGARIAARAALAKDVPAGERWGGMPAAPMRAWVRERYLIGRLERIWRQVRRAERDAGR
jgi:UDP-3-O-[3-hydroxymyristoyl] glucosamine N-acyltransferase